MLTGKATNSDAEIKKIKEFPKVHKEKMAALLQPVNVSHGFFFQKYPALAQRIFLHTKESRSELKSWMRRPVNNWRRILEEGDCMDTTEQVEAVVEEESSSSEEAAEEVEVSGDEKEFVAPVKTSVRSGKKRA